MRNPKSWIEFEEVKDKVCGVSNERENS